MDIGIIVQARIGSRRLPRKMILPFHKDDNLLETILSTLIKANFKIPIVLATTVNPEDNVIEKTGLNMGLDVFRGSEHNVLSRFIGAAEKHGFKKVIRVCADNPFIDIKDLKHQINSFKTKNVDYWTYCTQDKTPTIKTHFGFWTEGVSLNALKKIISNTKEGVHLEHVTHYIYTNPSSFNIHSEIIADEIEAEDNVRLTIDTMTDFFLVKDIYSKVEQSSCNLTASEVVNFVKKEPEWLSIMENEIIKNSK